MGDQRATQPGRRDGRASGERAQYWPARGDIGLLEAAFDRHVYERHTHETYAVGVTLRGVQRFWCRGATHDSVPGDVIVIPPGEVHDGRSGSSGGYAYRMLYLPQAVLTDAVADAPEHTAPRAVHGHAVHVRDATLARRLDSAWRAMRVDPTSLAAEELLGRALGRLCAVEPDGEDRGRLAPEPALVRVRDYLREHTHRRVRMNELAQLASMSRFQLTRRFAKAYGLPLHAYHVQVRLEEAKRRILRGATLASVAAELGFVDQSHLHRRFTGAFGVTPGAWREAGRQRGSPTGPACTPIQD